MSGQAHWEAVYGRKDPEDLTWYQPRLQQSLEFISSAKLAPEARIVDVGGGASTLVDDLLEAGHQNLAVIDLAASALEATRARLGDRAETIDWIVGDATEPLLPTASVDLWHDRAVFHFLVDPAARDAYLKELRRCLKPGGHCLVATFALDGPEKCSGLPISRYDVEGLHRVFGDAFEKTGAAEEHHQTPSGGTQSFTYCFFRRV